MLRITVGIEYRSFRHKDLHPGSLVMKNVDGRGGGGWLRLHVGSNSWWIHLKINNCTFFIFISDLKLLFSSNILSDISYSSKFLYLHTRKTHFYYLTCGCKRKWRGTLRWFCCYFSIKFFTFDYSFFIDPPPPCRCLKTFNLS